MRQKEKREREVRDRLTRTQTQTETERERRKEICRRGRREMGLRAGLLDEVEENARVDDEEIGRAWDR